MTINRTPDQRARHWASWQIALRTGVAGLAVVSAQAALANPSGGSVVAGQATINGQGTDRLRIDQASDRVVINWDNFSIGSGQGVDFRQPNARSIALNRVTGPEISQIMGELTANGQVYLINGNGIVFGKDARVDVAGLVATSADIGNDAFMAGGALRFGTPGRAGAKVINHGTITVRDAGMAAFVAPQVANDGIITAHMGRIAFGGAQAFTLDLHGDNLIRFQVGDAVRQLDDKGALVDIGGVVDARGGSLLITASAARDLVNQSVRIGTQQAGAMEIGADGKVSLVAAKMTITAPGEVSVGRNVAMDLSSATNAAVAGGRSASGKSGTQSNIGWVGTLDGSGSDGTGAASAPAQAMAANGSGGSLTITAARTILDGTINLDGSKTGGTAHIIGSDFLSFGAMLSASGADAGGNIQLDAGGFSLAGRITVNAGLGKGGTVDIHTTRRAIDTGDAFIDASGLHGGSIRYTSDQQIISSGKFRASGSHGFGGNIDVSAARLDLFSAQFYAQGGIRGGRVRLGGEFQGGKGLSVDELMNARTLVATDAVTIDVSAIGMRGNAGEIVVWSDEKTTFLGSAIARGGLVGGTGGQIEISGKETLLYRGTVDTARDGQRGGKLLLDPKNIIIAEGSSAPSQYGLVLQAFSSSFSPPTIGGPGVEAGDGFGAVSLDGNRLAVGASGDDSADGTLTDVGAVYLFSFADAAFAAPTLQAIVGKGYVGGRNVSVEALDFGDQFGSSVSLAGARLAVGAPLDDGPGNGGTDAGAVYLFSFTDLTFNGGVQQLVVGLDYIGAGAFAVAGLVPDDRFGTGVSLDGNRLAVGAPLDDGAFDLVADSGAVYLFTFTDPNFSNPVQQGRIGVGYTGPKDLSILELDTNDRFGNAVSLDGNRLAIGSVFDDGQGDAGSDHGAIYLISFADAQFSAPAIESRIGLGYAGPKDFDVPGLAASDQFGDALSLDGNRLAVTARFDDGLGDAFTDSGAVYLFTFADPNFGNPRLSGMIGANYGSLGGKSLSIAGVENSDTIGSVSLDGNRLVIGVGNDDGRTNVAADSGAVYLFTFEDDVFNNGRQAGVLGSGYTDFTGLSLVGNGLDFDDRFGDAISLDGNRLAVGAPGDDGAGNAKANAGAVYLFSFGDAQFSAPVLEAIIGSGYSGGKNLSVSRLDINDNFGASVSLDGVRLAVGAVGDGGINDTVSKAGAVYLFSFADPALGAFAGGQLRYVLNFETMDPIGGAISTTAASFGSAVSLSGNRIVVGAPGDSGPANSGVQSGAVHVFDLDPLFVTAPNRLLTIGNGYTGGNQIAVADLDDKDEFGRAVSLDGLTLAIGAPGDDGFENDFLDTGAAYIYTFTGGNFTGGTLARLIGAFHDFTPIGIGTGATDADRFGSSLALHGLNLVVGAAGDDGRTDGVVDSGAAYLFNFTSGDFSALSQIGVIGADYLQGNDFSVGSRASDSFGSAVDLDGSRMVIGASRHSGVDAAVGLSGATYLFTFDSPSFGNLRLAETLGAGYSGQHNAALNGLANFDRAGGSVSLDGMRLAIGAPGDDGAANTISDAGAVYLFSFGDLQFSAPVLQAVVGAGYSGGKNVSIALDNDDGFGTSVSLFGQQLAVGAPGDQGADNGGEVFTGAVYLLTFGDLAFGSGTVQAILGEGYTGGKNLNLISTIQAGDLFGRSVSLGTNALAVGAPGDPGAMGAAPGAGAAYLFTFSDAAFSGGQQIARITRGTEALSPNLIVPQLDASDNFGWSVSLNRANNRLFVGAPGDQGATNSLQNAGAVYQFDFADPDFGTGMLTRTFGAGYTGGMDQSIASIGDADRFGSSVATDGFQLAVGAAGDNGANSSREATGAVYLFLDAGPEFLLTGILGAGYGGVSGLSLGVLDDNDAFGSSVSLSQNRLAVGAPGDQGRGEIGQSTGAVYLFSFSDNGFSNPLLTGTIGLGYAPQKNLTIDPLNSQGNLGGSVALRGTQLAIGVPGSGTSNGVGIDLGAVYLFTFADLAFSVPTLTGVLGSGYTGAGNFDLSILEIGDRFGAAVSLDGLRLAVGAPGDNGANNDTTAAGAVYLFSFADTAFASPVLEARVGRDYTNIKNVNVTDLAANDRFGSSVSLLGNQLAVGVPGDDGAASNRINAGSVQLYTFTNAAFNGGARVGTIGFGYSGQPSDFDVVTLDSADRFGTAVALNGPLGLAIGAPGDAGFSNGIGADTGAVYTFLFADSVFIGPSAVGQLGNGYEGISNLNMTDLEAGDNFGASIAFDGGLLAIGATGDAGGTNASGANTGAVYLFTATADLFDINDAGVVGQGVGGSLNYAVPGLTAGDNFGSAIALDNGRMIIGAAGDDGAQGTTDNYGAVYLFEYLANFESLTLTGTLGRYANGTSRSLAADGIATNERFGVAVSLDGLRLAIGSSDDGGSSGLKPLSGAVYLLTFGDLAFGAPVLQSVIGAGYSGGKNLSVANLGANDFFGISVALDGNVLAVGALGDDGIANDQTDVGAVYLFGFADAQFAAPSLQATIGRGYAAGFDLDPGLGSEDYFGRSVALDGQRLAVGAPGDDGFEDGISDSGAVYLFTFSGAFPSTIVSAGKIGNSYGGLADIDLGALEFGDAFGTSVALDGRALAVGARNDDGGTPSSFFDLGAVYTFAFADDTFGGGSLRATIGYGYTGTNDVDLSQLSSGDYFGTSVSLNGNRLAVGATQDDGLFNDTLAAGAVYLFSFTDAQFSGPVLEATIGRDYFGDKNVALALDSIDLFGTAVSLDGNRLAVGAAGDDGFDNVQFDNGSVSLFTFADAAFNGGKLVGSIGAGYRSAVGLDLTPVAPPPAVSVGAGDQLGNAVALNGNRLAIGAPGDAGVLDGLAQAGAVYLFTFTDAEFAGASLEAVIGHGYVGGKNLWATQVGAGDQFGFSVSLDGNQLAVGAPFDDGAADTVADAGAVYLFSFTDAAFAGGALQSIIGSGYTGGKNLNLATALDGGDLFGTSVSLDANRLAVGSPNDTGFNNIVAGNPQFQNGGAAYLFSFTDAQFSNAVLEARIGAGYTGPKDRDLLADTLDRFGSAVSLDGTRLVVGASGDDGLGNTITDSGVAYLWSFSDLAFNGVALIGVIGANYSNTFSYSVAGLGAGDNFGAALSYDGSRLVIGAPGDDGATDSASDSGSVYLISFDGPGYSGGVIDGQIGRGYSATTSSLDFSRIEAGDFFGRSVSLDGSRLAVGASGDGGFGNAATGSGAVYLFGFANEVFDAPTLSTTLGVGYTRGLGTSVDGLGATDLFGWSLSLDGNRLAVGAPQDSGAAGSGFAGAVYLFSFADAQFSGPALEGVLGEGYTGGKNLDVPGLAPSAFFGGAVSLDGNRLAVGASNLNGGSVFLFTFADAAFATPQLASLIGVGATGPNNLAVPAVVGDFFGGAVSLDGNRLAVGAPLDDGAGDSLTDSGAVYLFSFADAAFTTPVQEAIIGADYTGGKNVSLAALDANDHFGTSVSLQGLRLAVGADYDDGAGNSNVDSGAVRLFAMSAPDFSSVSQVGTIGFNYSGAGSLNVSRLGSNDWFGRSVSLDGDRLAIGAVNDSGANDDRFSAGAAYIIGFGDAGFGTPSLRSIIGHAYFDPNDVAVGTLEGFDFFGQGISLDAGRLVVGAPYDDGPDNKLANSGAAYFFSLTGGTPATPGFGFADNPGSDVTISASSLAEILSGGTAVELQANNDISVNSAILVNNASGTGGALSFRAGRSILINAGITTDGGNFSAISNDSVASGVVDAFRDPGNAVISFGAGGFIDAGAGNVFLNLRSGNGLTFSDSGAISLGSITASAITVLHAGTTGDNIVTVNSGAVLTASGTGDAIVVLSEVFNNLAGAGAFTFTGGGRFLVYASDYDTIGRGGLTGNSLYNRSFIDAEPGTVVQPGNLFIFQRQPILTFTADDASRTYGQGAPAYTFQFAGLVNGDTAGYAFSGAPNLFDTASGNAGTDTIFIEQGTLLSDVGYGFDFVAGALTTLRALLTARADDQTRQYGLANPAFTVTYSGFVNGDDESVILAAPTAGTLADATSDVGSYAITLGDGFASNYVFDYVPGTLTITKALLTVTANDASREYGLANPAFTGSIAGFRNSDTASVVSGLVYGSVATAASNVGTYAITGSGATATNYDFVYTPGTLTITKALLTVTADNASREYGLANPAFTGTIAGFRNSDNASVVSGLTYGSVATAASNVGTYGIIGAGATATNYDFAYTPGTLTITRALLTVTANDASREYGLANPTFTGSIAGLRNGDTASVVSGLVYNTAATTASNVGTFAITASGGTATNYDFAYAPGTLTITRALLTVTADNANREYGLANPAFTGSIAGFRNSDTASVVSGLTYGSVATIASNAGTYAITGSGATATNYDFAYTPGTLTITKALLTVTADNASREYGLANPAFTGTIAGFRNSDDASVVSGLTYGSVATAASNVGTYGIIGAGATATNYDFAYTPGTLTITRALLTVTANDASREYGLANPAFTGSIAGLRNGDTASVVSGLVYNTAATTASNVGTFAITASGGTATNYDFAYAPGTLTITRALLTVTADNASREYGLANPAFTGTIAGYRNGDTGSVVSGLTYGSVATISSNAGTYAITGSGATATNYDFVYTPGTLTITKALLTVTADNASREYGLANPAFTGTIAGFRNSDDASVVSGLTYGSVATAASNVGTYGIIGAGATATNYDFAYTPGTLTITRALLTVTANDASREYGLANPAFTGSIAGLRNGDTASVVSGLVYNTAATTASNVGTFAITASGGTATNYDFAYALGTLTITRALLTVTADNASREYGLANPAFTGSIAGFRNSDNASVVSGLTYGSVATIASNAGTYAITGSGATATNYDFAYTPGTLTITRALLTVTANDASREYGLANPAFTGSIAGFRNGDTASVVSGLTYGSVATAASNVGTYGIIGAGATATNYDFAYTPGTLTITRALLTVTANDASREYGLANPAFTGSIAGLRNGDTASVVSGLVYNTAATTASNVGTFAITASGGTATNYDFTYAPGTLTITRALLTVTADNASREYGLANPAFTGSIAGFRNSDNASVVSGLTYGSVATIASNAGTYAITGSGATATNYDFAYTPGTLTITKALLTVTADNASREYGLANPAFTGTIAGFRNGDTASVVSGLTYGSVATAASNVGTYGIIGAGATATNYDFAYTPGTLTITRALLTVTANDASREYGLANPAFTGSIAGLRNGDTASVVSGLVYGSSAGAASNVGTYAITGSGAAATNYNFAYVPGTLTITRALLTVTADNASREYGLANPAFTGSIAGLRNGDTVGVVSGLSYGSAATAASNVGSFAITASGGSAVNYNFAYVPGTLTITKALLTVTADNKAREYGLANPALTATIAGLRNGDSAGVVSGLSLATAATTASNVGSYAIGVSGGSAANYDFAYVPGTLSVTQALLTVTIDSKTRVYGELNPALTASIAGFRNGDTADVVSGLRLTTGAIARSDAGDYLITGSSASATNYRFAYSPGVMTVTKALLQVRVDNTSREYGLANPAFTARIIGFRNGDNASMISGLVLSTNATAGSDVGAYAITASGASALNYDFAYTPGRLSIDQARLLITANNIVMHQGSGDPVLTVSYSGLRNGDTGDVVSGLVMRSSGGGTASPGQYIINASRGTARNYQITYRPGIMTVLPAIVPPAQDPPATGPTTPAPPPVTGGVTPPAGTPPVTTPPVTTPPVTTPPTGGTATPAPVAGDASTPAAQVASPAQTGSAASAGLTISMPTQGTVKLPVSPEAPPTVQVLQGLAGPLPVLISPETQPADSATPGNAPQADGQDPGCQYISLCSGTARPLWTFQPSQ